MIKFQHTQARKKLEKRIFSRLLLAILPMLAMVVFTYFSLFDLPENKKVILQLICENGANDIQRFFQTQRDTFNYWIEDDIYGMSIEFQTIDELKKHFRSLIKTHKGFCHLALTDLNGKVIVATSSHDHHGQVEKDITGYTIKEITDMNGNENFFEKYVASQFIKMTGLDNYYTCVFGFKTRDTSGHHNGFFLAYIDWETMKNKTEMVHNEMKNKGFGQATVALIEHSSGIAISHTNPGLERKKVYKDHLLDNWLEEGKSGKFHKQTADKRIEYVSFFPVDTNNVENDQSFSNKVNKLSLATFVPETLIMHDVRKIFWTSAISAIVCSLFVFLVGFLISKGVKGPLGLVVAEINTASEELKIAAKHQLTNTANQVTGTAELNTNIEEQVASSRQLAEIANNFVSVAEATDRSANMGKQSLEATVSGVEAIKSQVEKIAENMLALNEKTQQMNIALDIINELSAQTTILSYNATIEAAGAGESGKRFSAIAEQIMKLATKATESTKDISFLVEDIQKGGNKTILTTEEGSKSVNRGMQLLLETVNHFDNIQTSAEENLTSAKEMDMTISQQTNAIEQAADSIRNIQFAAEDVKQSSEETLRTAEQMLSMARKLAEL